MEILGHEVNSKSFLGGDTGESYKIVTDKGTFKIRECRSLRRAKEIEKFAGQASFLLPKFYGRFGNVLVFEFIRGRRLGKEEPMQTYYQLGKLHGRLNKISAKPRRIWSRVLKYIDYCVSSKLIGEEFASKLKKNFLRLKRKLQFKYVLDFTDFHPWNFMKNDSGRLYFVDEDGLIENVKGYGLAKPFNRRWFRKSKNREEFVKGYNSVNDFSYFTEDYELFVNIYFNVVKLARQHKKGIFNEKYLKTLQGLELK
jgi:thiamine kinase-like enzyme